MGDSSHRGLRVGREEENRRGEERSVCRRGGASRCVCRVYSRQTRKWACEGEEGEEVYSEGGGGNDFAVCRGMGMKMILLNSEGWNWKWEGKHLCEAGLLQLVEEGGGQGGGGQDVHADRALGGKQPDVV
jgi:hypothetical protein